MMKAWLFVFMLCWAEAQAVAVAADFASSYADRKRKGEGTNQLKVECETLYC
jgi:hypothetical protein